MSNTIAAIATAHGLGGVAIIRISGNNAYKIVQRVIVKGNSASLQPRTMHSATFRNISGEIIDYGLVCFFPNPNSFTGEDVVEIHCHGGIAAPNSILSALIYNGARLAEPGEFTRRAFLNGKLDLTQAEAVGGIIDAKTENSLKATAALLQGALSKRILAIREVLLAVTASLAAVIDFPEEDVEDLSRPDLISALNCAKNLSDDLLSTASSGKVIRCGYNVPILGIPNVGKSSLLNALLGEDRAIVTPIAGTTRDVLRESANIGGWQVNLSDTAGIRESEDEVEKIGVERALSSLDSADFVIVLLDASRKISAEEQDLLEKTADFERIIVKNKSDLINVPNSSDECIYISAQTHENLQLLLEKITSLCSKYAPRDDGIIATARQESALVQTIDALDAALSTIEGGIPLDLALDDLELALSCLGEIDGQTVRDEIINNIFSRFCVGK